MVRAYGGGVTAGKARELPAAEVSPNLGVMSGVLVGSSVMGSLTVAVTPVVAWAFGRFVFGLGPANRSRS